MRRLLLVWLLVCALPAQALAAAMLLHCHVGGPQRHAMAGHPAGPGAVGHASWTTVSMDHAGHADYAGDSAPGLYAASSDSDPSRADHPTPGLCSACAACCLGAAPVSHLSARPASQAGQRVPAAPVASFGSGVLDLPDRPPRSVLA